MEVELKTTPCGDHNATAPSGTAPNQQGGAYQQQYAQQQPQYQYSVAPPPQQYQTAAAGTTTTIIMTATAPAPEVIIPPPPPYSLTLTEAIQYTRDPHKFLNTQSRAYHLSNLFRALTYVFVCGWSVGIVAGDLVVRTLHDGDVTSSLGIGYWCQSSKVESDRYGSKTTLSSASECMKDPYLYRCDREKHFLQASRGVACAALAAMLFFVPLLLIDTRWNFCKCFSSVSQNGARLARAQLPFLCVWLICAIVCTSIGGSLLKNKSWCHSGSSYAEVGFTLGTSVIFAIISFIFFAIVELARLYMLMSGKFPRAGEVCQYAIKDGVLRPSAESSVNMQQQAPLLAPAPGVVAQPFTPQQQQQAYYAAAYYQQQQVYHPPAAYYQGPPPPAGAAPVAGGVPVTGTVVQ